MRNGTALSVLLLDVDFFKRYNDHYGHQAGDECLRQVAAALQQGSKRPGDLVARYGGEEFACLLPDTPLAGALAFARQLGARRGGTGPRARRSAVADVVTVSVGACTKPFDAAGTAAALLREADAQLYLAKSRGRNQVCGAVLPI